MNFCTVRFRSAKQLLCWPNLLKSVMQAFVVEDEMGESPVTVSVSIGREEFSAVFVLA